MPAVTLRTLSALKQAGKRFACITCYDATFAQALAAADIEMILVGDSLGMVIQGQTSTLPVTLDDMVYHTQAVARGNQQALIMSDMPFMSYAQLSDALQGATRLMQAGAHLVKLEGGAWLTDTITQLNRGGIPVCVHLGLTPQSVHVLGGYRVQGRETAAADQLLEDARALEAAGAACLLLECVPRQLAARVTASVRIPVIGIGAGAACDGQVLVMHDLLGLGHSPARFVKNFLAEGDGTLVGAFQAFRQQVLDGTYPTEAHGFD